MNPDMLKPHRRYSVIARLLCRIFPPLGKYRQPARPFAELKREFQKWEIGITLLIPVLTMGIGFIWWSLFAKLGDWRFSSFPEATFILAGDRVKLIIPTFLLGGLTAGLVVDLLLKVLLKSRYPEYIAYQNWKFQINGEILGRLVGLIFVPGSIIILLMLINWYVIFTPNRIVIKPLFSFSEQSYHYSDIESLVSVPAITSWTGGKENRKEFIIKFHNGQEWTTNFSPVRLPSKEKFQILMYVSLKSGLAVNEKKVL
jgi:hypothetical protein